MLVQYVLLDGRSVIALEGYADTIDLNIKHIFNEKLSLSAHWSGSPDSLKVAVELGGLSLIDLLNLLLSAAALIIIDQDGLDLAPNAARQAILWRLGSAFVMVFLVLIKAPRTDYSCGQYSVAA